MSFHVLIAHFFLVMSNNIPLSACTSLFIIYLTLFAVLIAMLQFVNVSYLNPIIDVLIHMIHQIKYSNLQSGINFTYVKLSLFYI